MFTLKKSLTLSVVIGMFAGLTHADVPLPLSAYVNATSPEFSRTVITSQLKNPHNIVWGADNNLWLTEQQTGNIIRVNPETGKATTVFTVPDMVYDEDTQNGLLGIALDPKFGQMNHNFIYLSVSIKNPNATDKNYPNQTVVRRYSYDKKQDTLTQPTNLLTGLPSSHDHQGQRLVIGPDNKIYFSVGDQGANQLGYLFAPNQAQVLPTASQIQQHDFHAYAGKILRLNLDGSIPKDNPNLNGVVSHIYTLGHRNPQGLTFTPNGKLLSSEQSANSDDELNLIIKGGNYGWPNVSGYKDNNGYAYANYSAATGDKSQIKDPAQNGLKVPAGVPVSQESDFNDPNFIQPLKTLFTVSNDYNFNDSTCGKLNYICWPTVAASAVTFYQGGSNPIPGWKDSVLIPALKRGVIFRVQLDETHTVTKGDAIPMFRSVDRYRDIVVNPNGKVLYAITDSSGSVQLDDGSVSTKVAHPGSIIKFTYIGKK
ncbi:PQQ-dependent sugar dehydrogenase [Acinetobacter sp. MD2]|nr:PQQ-dependent sugar dehydrogenase [Acinetobacter sp. MD2]